VFEDVIPFPAARFSLHSDDPTFTVQRRGGARFLVSGEVSRAPAMELGVETPSGGFEVPLAQKTTADQAVSRLKRALPRDVAMTRHTTPEGVEVRLTEAVVPAARPPRLRLLSTDLVQRVRQLEENKVELIGSVGADCHLTIFCDTRRVTIALTQGTPAQATAIRIAGNVPSGYRALVDGPTVAVWKDADFFEAVG